MEAFLKQETRKQWNVPKTHIIFGILNFEKHSGDFTSNALHLLLKIPISGTLEDGFF